ncbi:MAG: acetate/propionate family kinase [Burkholderiales bacterium]|nr:acetate/propionate family kinase [Burkholderiales bacterium]MDE2432837.1 acetate/propionate family kinase [Burkholderiales bacterium]
MTDAVVVVNAGSSSLKFAVLAARDLRPLVSGQVEGLQTAPHVHVESEAGDVLLEHRWPDGTALTHEDAVAYLLDNLHDHLDGHQVKAVGHRIVHGGSLYREPVLLTPEVLQQLASLIPLAPLHQPHNLSPVHAFHKLAPHLPQVGCFDTAFHATNPPVAQAFALPASLAAEGVRRYGFHGLSYEYIASQLPHVDPRAAAGRTVVMHLGNGASMCALQGGRSVASTMGFTALDGLPMGTRCGTIDVGVVLWLMDQKGMGARQIEKLLYSQSGLLGVSGESSDMRTLLASGSDGARRAVDLYVYRIGRELGSLAAALGGLDAMVFTAGIGEHAVPIRARVAQGAAWLGVKFDEAANERVKPGAPVRISSDDSAVAVWVVPTNEERMIALHVCAVALQAGA